MGEGGSDRGLECIDAIEDAKCVTGYHSTVGAYGTRPNAKCKAMIHPQSDR
jgi:hypothetical protein